MSSTSSFDSSNQWYKKYCSSHSGLLRMTTAASLLHIKLVEVIMLTSFHPFGPEPARTTIKEISQHWWGARAN